MLTFVRGKGWIEESDTFTIVNNTGEYTIALKAAEDLGPGDCIFYIGKGSLADCEYPGIEGHVKWFKDRDVPTKLFSLYNSILDYYANGYCYVLVTPC